MDSKIQTSKELLETQGLTNDKESITKLLKHTALWGRLDTAMKRSQDADTKTAWEKLKEKGAQVQRQGKTEKKNLMLANFIAFGDGWEKHNAVVTKTLMKAETNKLQKEAFYRGELIQMHGLEEADRFINEGKFF